ncbi:MAG: hypothetical protein ISS93_00310 [Candidatus Aenigmarchaeota archaeon]|nr:hypothetical protein [Candidatus Aenigmarchaeota archaeon]
MLDWKILAASIAALLFISSIFIGGLGIRDTFSGIIEKISEYLDTSPFTGMIPAAAPSGGSGEVTILLSPPELTLVPDSPTTLKSGETVFSGFEGQITLNLPDKTVALSSGSLEITFPLQSLELESLEINSLSLEGIPMEIKPEISTDSGNLQLQGFTGSATATPEGLELTGKVSSLRVTIGDLNFELV